MGLLEKASIILGSGILQSVGWLVGLLSFFVMGEMIFITLDVCYCNSQCAATLWQLVFYMSLVVQVWEVCKPVGYLVWHSMCCVFGSLCAAGMTAHVLRVCWHPVCCPCIACVGDHV